MKKLAIVTGANKGLGLSVAQRLVHDNYKVILACRDKTKGQQAEKFLGENATFIELDLSDSTSIDNFSNEISQSYSGVDVLYNNAGLIYQDFNLTAEGFESMIAVNYFGTYRLTLKLLDNLLENEGKDGSGFKPFNVPRKKNAARKPSHQRRVFHLQVLDTTLTNLYRSMFAYELEKRTRW